MTRGGAGDLVYLCWLAVTVVTLSLSGVRREEVSKDTKDMKQGFWV